MHFVSGGAFQGKRKWVNVHYSFAHTSYSWYCAYENMFPLPHDETASVVVLEGIEHWIREYFFLIRTMKRKRFDRICARGSDGNKRGNGRLFGLVAILGKVSCRSMRMNGHGEIWLAGRINS